MRVPIIVFSAVAILVAVVLFARRESPSDEDGQGRRGVAGRTADGRGVGDGERGQGEADGGGGAAAARREGLARAVRDRLDAERAREAGEALVVPGVPGKGIGGRLRTSKGDDAAGAAAGAAGVAGADGGVDPGAAADGADGSSGAAAADGGAEGESPEGAVPDVLFSSSEDEQYDTTDPTDVPDSADFPRGAGSVSFWLEPGWDAGNQDDADFIDLGDGGLRVVKNVNYLRFEFTDANGIEGGVGVDISGWKSGEPHQIAATWDGDNVSLYVDGQLVSQRPHGGFHKQDEPGAVVIGSDYPPDRPVAPGVLTDVQFFGRPLGPGEIAPMHEAGKQKRR